MTRIQYVRHAQRGEDVLIEGDLDDRDFTATYLRDGMPVAALLAGRPRELPKLRREIDLAYQGRHTETEAMAAA